MKINCAVLLSAAVNSMYEESNIASVSTGTLRNVFSITLDKPRPDCSVYVTDYLNSMGVPTDTIQWRTKYNLGEFGNICSLYLDEQYSEILFAMPNVKVSRVSMMFPMQQKIQTNAEKLLF